MKATGVKDIAGQEDTWRTFGHGIAAKGLKSSRLAENEKLSRYLRRAQDTPYLPLP